MLQLICMVYDEYCVRVETVHGDLERRKVELGMETPEKIEIISGIREDESVGLE